MRGSWAAEPRQSASGAWPARARACCRRPARLLRKVLTFMGISPKVGVEYLLGGIPIIRIVEFSGFYRKLPYLFWGAGVSGCIQMHSFQIDILSGLAYVHRCSISCSFRNCHIYMRSRPCGSRASFHRVRINTHHVCSPRGTPLFLRTAHLSLGVGS